MTITAAITTATAQHLHGLLDQALKTAESAIKYYSVESAHDEVRRWQAIADDLRELLDTLDMELNPQQREIFSTDDIQL